MLTFNKPCVTIYFFCVIDRLNLTKWISLIGLQENRILAQWDFLVDISKTDSVLYNDTKYISFEKAHY
jgi:hypothetical protein